MAGLSELAAAQGEPDPIVEGPTSPWLRSRPRLAVLGSAAFLALIPAMLALESVGADADKPKDPHDTLN